jgi:hypothetical protein
MDGMVSPVSEVIAERTREMLREPKFILGIEVSAKMLGN